MRSKQPTSRHFTNPTRRQIFARCRRIRAQWDRQMCERRSRLATANLLNIWELLVHDMEATVY